MALSLGVGVLREHFLGAALGNDCHLLYEHCGPTDHEDATVRVSSTDFELPTWRRYTAMLRATIDTSDGKHETTRNNSKPYANASDPSFGV